VLASATRDILVRSVIWVALIGLWMNLTLPHGADLSDVRSGLPRLGGLAALLLGLCGYAWSATWLVRGAPITERDPVALLTAGPFGYVRNPLYLSVGVMLVGLSTLYRPWSLSNLIGAAILAGVVHIAVVRYEEPSPEGSSAQHTTATANVFLGGCLV
jgi:protein-S-isoprenylcysteine O-methyltransferase Ste14